MNEQRELVYKQRKRVLEGENMRDRIMDMIKTKVSDCVNISQDSADSNTSWDIPELNRSLRNIIPLPPITEEYVKDMKSPEDLKEKLFNDAVKLYEAKEAEVPEEQPDMFREIERVILLRCIDRHWMQEIDDMDQLRQGIGLQAYGQRNPVDEYKMQSYDMMDAMNDAITTDTVNLLYRVRIEQKETERQEVAKPTGTNKEAGPSASGPKKRSNKKVYPNDPCPCGSGKKYKNCHGRPGAAPL
jgi:preprotein translocase subunit SecA